MRALKGLGRVGAYALSAALLLAIALVLIIGFMPGATRFAVDTVARMASTPDRTIAVREPSGLLTGRLRAGAITVADSKGVYLELHDLAVDWSPSSLIGGRFHADRIAAGSVNLQRAPIAPKEEAGAQPAATETSSSGFSLPLAIEVGKIDLPDIRLGPALAGREFALAAAGSLRADSRSVDLILNANRRDVTEAKLTADVAFAPAENRLRLKAQLAEPKGGLLASMLDLPNDPALNMDIVGEGPLSDWKGKLQAALDGQPRVTIEGHHKLTAEGQHSIAVKGGGDVQSLLPPAFRQLFAGQTTIDVSSSFDNKGKIDIQTGNLATGAFVLAASGTLDPAGNNSLNANLIGTAGPVDFRWPLEEGEARALITRVDLALTGAAQAVKIDTKATLDSASTPDAKFDKISLTARSDAFDLSSQSGPLQVRLDVAESSFKDPNLNRLVRAPLTLIAPLQLSPESVGFNGTSLESASIGGTVNGKYTLASKSLTGNFKLFVLPDALPEAASGKFSSTIALEGQLASTLPTKFRLSNFSLKSDTLELGGNVALEDKAVTADLSGRALNLSKLIANADGQADFTLKAKGPLTAAAVEAGVKAVNVKLAGKLLDTLDIAVTGTADPKAPQGNVKASGSIDGKPISIVAEAVSKDGRTSVPALSLKVGANTVEGKLDLSPAFEPVGALTFDLPDVGLLAALGGQQASGDLKGSVDITNSNGKIGLKLNATGSGIRRDDLAVIKPEIALTVDDLKAFSANGSVRAAEIASGANRVTGLGLTFKQHENRTDFDLNATYDSRPLTANGNVETGNGQTTVSLDSFAATPRTIPVNLAAPSRIVIRDGTVTLDNLTIRTGSGSIAVSGTAGETLRINARISDLPASLANAFAAGLDAAGTISGTVSVTGKPAAPVVDFQANWTNAATSQTRSAGLGALALRTNGRFADNRVTVETLNLTGAGGLTLNGSGNAAIAGNRALALRIDGTLPFTALAGQLAAQGLDMTGSARINLQVGGTAAAPLVTGTITTDGTRLVDVRRNMALNGLAVTITLDGRQATISRLSGTLATGGSISASGTIGIQPASGFPADINVRLDRATYVDGTLVTATVSGTLNVRGPLLTAPVLSGTLQLARASITIPEKLPASLSALNIQHRNAPPAVLAQFGNQPQGPREKSTVLGLDLRIDAPSQIFVRGRGIDAELGGNVAIRGTGAAPIVSGGFTMRRGRLTILSRRLDFSDKSKITFAGDMTPALDMSATSTVSSTTVTVTVTGVANDPTIAFSSSPALPQDEVLAQLIFGQSMSRLSALQIAQLADAASQLAGGRSTSLFEGLRSHLGIDNLDVTTDSRGRAQVSAGKYLNKRTYIELQQGGDNTSKAIINFDVGRGVKLRGAAGSNGAGEAGIVYEREY